MNAIDLSTEMLDRARRKLAREHAARVDLREMDAQALDLPSNQFDDVVATFVFCSVPDGWSKTTKR